MLFDATHVGDVLGGDAEPGPLLCNSPLLILRSNRSAATAGTDLSGRMEMTSAVITSASHMTALPC